MAFLRRGTACCARRRCLATLLPIIRAFASPRSMWSAAACRRCIRAKLASPDPRSPNTRRPRTGNRRHLRLPQSCRTSRQAGTANSGGKPPHSTWAEALPMPGAWGDTAKHVCRARRGVLHGRMREKLAQRGCGLCGGIAGGSVARELCDGYALRQPYLRQR
jgi:hypothetical protein